MTSVIFISRRSGGHLTMLEGMSLRKSARLYTILLINGVEEERWCVEIDAESDDLNGVTPRAASVSLSVGLAATAGGSLIELSSDDLNEFSVRRAVSRFVSSFSSLAKNSRVRASLSDTVRAGEGSPTLDRILLLPDRSPSRVGDSDRVALAGGSVPADGSLSDDLLAN
jgi:hypothetical protein